MVVSPTFWKVLIHLVSNKISNNLLLQVGPCQPSIKPNTATCRNGPERQQHTARKLLQSSFAAAAGLTRRCRMLGCPPAEQHFYAVLYQRLVGTCFECPPLGEESHTPSQSTLLSLISEEWFTNVKKYNVLFCAFWKGIVWAKHVKHTVLQSSKFPKGNGEQDLQACHSPSGR